MTDFKINLHYTARSGIDSTEHWNMHFEWDRLYYPSPTDMLRYCYVTLTTYRCNVRNLQRNASHINDCMTLVWISCWFLACLIEPLTCTPLFTYQNGKPVHQAVAKLVDLLSLVPATCAFPGNKVGTFCRASDTILSSRFFIHVYFKGTRLFEYFLW